MFHPHYDSTSPPSHHQSNSNNDPNPSQENSQEDVIDPNLYGPLGHRYHEEYQPPAHIHHAPHLSESTPWHEIETTEQHQRHSSGITPYQSNANAASVFHLLPDSYEGGAPSYRRSGSGSGSQIKSGSAAMSLEHSKQSSSSHSDSHSHSTGHGHSRVQSKVNSIFEMVHGKEGSSTRHIAEHGEDIPLKLTHLFKRPIIRQWIHGGNLYREKEERKASQFELFFDLIFVAVVNGLGHATAESSSGVNVLKFVLSFWPCFSIWTDVRIFLNTSGTDDVLERIILLGWMILLCGYCANVSGIEIVLASAESIAASKEGEGGSGGSPDHRRRALGLVSRALFGRSGGGSEAAEPVLARPAIGNYWFTEGYDKAMHSAIAFFLVAKLWRIGIYIYYGVTLPKFRKALWLNALAMTLITLIYLPILFTKNPLLIALLMLNGIALELLRSYLVAGLMICVHNRSKHNGQDMFIPALSPDHSIERYVLFVILIVGESIISSTFVAKQGLYGLNPEFGRSAIGITISFFVIWLYYDADASRVFQHALRRNAFTSITFCHIHFPLTAALILMAASLSSLIKGKRVEGVGYVWYFGGSLSVVMLCIALIGCMHRNLDLRGSTLIPRWIRLTVRFIAAAAFAVLPIRYHSNTLHIMGIYASILAFVVSFETLGKVGAVGRKYDAERAAALKIQEYPLPHPSHPHPSLSSTLPMKSFVSEEKGIPPVTRRLKLDKRSSWHPYDDLTPGERGEEDVGIESEIGHLEEKTLPATQRWAYAA